MKKSELKKIIRTVMCEADNDSNHIKIMNAKLKELGFKPAVKTLTSTNNTIETGKVDPNKLGVFGMVFTDISYTVDVYDEYDYGMEIKVEFRYKHPGGGTTGKSISYVYSYAKNSWAVRG